MSSNTEFDRVQEIRADISRAVLVIGSRDYVEAITKLESAIARLYAVAKIKPRTSSLGKPM